MSVTLKPNYYGIATDKSRGEKGKAKRTSGTEKLYVNEKDNDTNNLR